MTSRDIQAQKTKEKIFETARQLFAENGIDQTSVKTIVTAAGVSVGAFYQHFKSKEEIISAIYSQEDSYFLDLAQSLTNGPVPDRILAYFEAAVSHIIDQGYSVVSILYQPTNPYLYKDNIIHTHRGLIELIGEGQDATQICADRSAEEIARYLLLVSSGIIFEWCIAKGNFDISVRNKEYMTLALQPFLL